MEIRDPAKARHAQAVKTNKGHQVRFVNDADDHFDPVPKKKATFKINTWKTSDIRLHKDSAGYFTAEHVYQGTLIDSHYFDTRNEARREAVVILREFQAEQED